MEAARAAVRSAVPRRSGSKHLRVSPSLRLRLVRLCLEEQYPLGVVASESGVSAWSLRQWVVRYLFMCQ
jgi:transposase-like protein